MKSTMLQEVMVAPKEITFREIPVPKINEDQVLVRIRIIGICGSDVHVYHGAHPFTKYPITQGHEVSGDIVEIGKNVKGLHVGQKVTIEPQEVCGKCHPCRHGKYNLCENLKVMGFQTTGAASTYFATDSIKITPFPEDMTFEEGAMIEPLAVAVHAVERIGDVEGLNIAVIGAGPIGNLIAQTAKVKGATGVLVTDLSDYRLNLVRSCGVDYTYNTSDVNFERAMISAFGPDKADVIFDCAGNDSTINQAIKYARKGSIIILVAVFEKIAKIDLALLNDHELDLNTSMMYRHEDYLQAIKMVSEKRIQLKPLMSQIFPFKQFPFAYEYIDQNREKTMKILIDVQNQT